MELNLVFWNYYNYIAPVVIVSQFVFIVQTYRNFRYALKKARQPAVCRPRTLLTVPCRGVDNAFEKNITSFFNLDYENYHLCFVVQDQSDPAYAKLCRLKDKLSRTSKALDVRILIAGVATGCSQKIHNLLCSCRQVPCDTEIFAFGDSDICVSPDWLKHLVYPLRQPKYGASTGYRWFVPERNNIASLAMSAINAKIAQLLGDTRFNQAWGGSMAIRVETFGQIGLEKIWQQAISDDLTLSYAVKKAGLKVIFAPGCLVASYEQTTWSKLFEFARRQFLITRVTIPRTWWFGLFSSVYSLAGLWGGGAIAIRGALTSRSDILIYAAVPIVFLAGQFFRSILRQKMFTILLPEDATKLKPAMLADIFGNWLWSWVLFVCIISSAVGHRIVWRGIRYKLISPTETIIDQSRDGSSTR